VTNIGPGVPMTERQEAIWLWMIDYLDRNERPASLREIGKAFGIRSPNGVMSHMLTLMARGKVRKVGNGTARGFIPVRKAVKA